MGIQTESQWLNTTGDVMAVLGGPLAVSQLTGASYKQVWGWGKDETFPSRYFLVMTWKLRQKRRRAPPSLWGMVTVPEMLRATG